MEKDKNKILWILAGIVILLTLLGSFEIGGYGMMSSGFGMMGFGAIFMIIFWGAIIWLILVAVNPNHSTTKEENPKTILKKRYANGEITKKEYEEMKKELEK